jgi:stearoyl-CoA desaturase (delta-9 desaturase)
VRIAIHNHSMFAVNSICHAFGSQPFATGDESRNNRLIALFAFGEGWHNNHHAHPTSARHGLAWYEVDFNWLAIRSLQSVGLVWNIKRAPLD